MNEIAKAAALIATALALSAAPAAVADTAEPPTVSPIENSDVAGYEWGPAIDLLASLTGDYVSEWDEVELTDGRTVRVAGETSPGMSYTFDEEGWQRFLADADAVGLDVDADSMWPMFDNGWDEEGGRPGKTRRVYASVNVSQQWPLYLGEGRIDLTLNVLRGYMSDDGTGDADELRQTILERLSNTSNYERYMTTVEYTITVGSDGRAKVECLTPTWQYQQWEAGRTIGAEKLDDMTLRDTKAVDAAGADSIRNAYLAWSRGDEELDGNGWSFDVLSFPDSYSVGVFSRSDGKPFEEPLTEDPSGEHKLGQEVTYRKYAGRAALLADSEYDEVRNGDAYKVVDGTIVGFYEDRAVLADDEGDVTTVDLSKLTAMLAYADAVDWDPVGKYEVGDAYVAVAEGVETRLEVIGFVDGDAPRVLLEDPDGKACSATYDNMEEIRAKSNPAATREGADAEI